MVRTFEQLGYPGVFLPTGLADQFDQFIVVDNLVDGFSVAAVKLELKKFFGTLVGQDQFIIFVSLVNKA